VTADVTITGQNGAQLRIAGYGIAYRQAAAEGGAVGHWTLIDRHQVRWLRDGPRTGKRPKWTLEIVLTSGAAIVAAAATSKGETADPDVLETVKRAARDHGYLTALTGKPTARMPEGRFAGAGLYPSPGAEPGLRDWDGTEWSATLHADPAGGPAGGTLATRWSALSKQEQHTHWEDAVSRLRGRKAGLATSRIFTALFMAGLVTGLAFTALTESVGALIGLSVTDVVLALGVSGCAVAAGRWQRSVLRHNQIAVTAQVAALRAGGHDVASAPERTWVVSRGRRKELRLDEHEITVREGGRTRFIAWDAVRWFRDSSSGTDWALAIVLRDGTVVTPKATMMSGGRAEDAAAKVSQAARQHAIPAVLTGRPARDWTSPTSSDPDHWAVKPGRYVDPGGELGIREWTGTEWLPELQVDPVAGEAAGQEGPATILSPLPGDVQRRLWEEAVSAVPRRGAVAGFMALFGVSFTLVPGWLYWLFAEVIAHAHGPGLVVLGSAGIILLTGAEAGVTTVPLRKARAAARAGRVAKAALTARPASTEV
jgi:hypothetical protein